MRVSVAHFVKMLRNVDVECAQQTSHLNVTVSIAECSGWQLLRRCGDGGYATQLLSSWEEAGAIDITLTGIEFPEEDTLAMKRYRFNPPGKSSFGSVAKSYSHHLTRLAAGLDPLELE